MPLDKMMRDHFKSHKSLGQTERSLISENVFKLVKYKIYLDTITKKPLNWEKRLDTLWSQTFKD